MDKKTLRKLKIENLTRCMNCMVFVSCSENLKEDVQICQKFVELSSQRQVAVVSLKELARSTSEYAHRKIWQRHVE